jgi:hypothetical protein
MKCTLRSSFAGDVSTGVDVGAGVIGFVRTAEGVGWGVAAGEAFSKSPTSRKGARKNVFFRFALMAVVDLQGAIVS